MLGSLLLLLEGLRHIDVVPLRQVLGKKEAIITHYDLPHAYDNQQFVIEHII